MKVVNSALVLHLHGNGGIDLVDRIILSFVKELVVSISVFRWTVALKLLM